jgi:hypothetical protein
MALKLKEKMREKREREKTRCQNLIETLIVIATRQEESSSRDEANDIKKDHCQTLDLAIRTAKKQQALCTQLRLNDTHQTYISLYVVYNLDFIPYSNSVPEKV